MERCFMLSFYLARDHRLHHKYSETDADPHNISRGIFFTHIGWTMIKEHPQVTEKEKTIDFSDLHNDPVVAFQHKYFRIFDLILYHAMPILIPYYLWLPSLYMCVCVNYLRFVISYNTSSLGNSVAHTWTRKPYQKDIGPSDVTWLSLLIVGEGWHNFHHVFPWDYRSTDIGLYVCNLATAFIDLMAKIGWAYDLKTVPDQVIRRRAARTGDGSHPHAPLSAMIMEETEVERKNSLTTDFNENQTTIDKLDVGDIEPAPWGWGDKDIPKEDVDETIVIHGKAD
ncbi:Acyl-CoA Delta(11) desaturase [Orchesella cincta]|uniref:Acyl-CoA Delta(11) desaturase n=1 Tax=Orchesella cincta TaxID=48709 RepID=A0A1D2NFQ2_ORCCI|nr:Acyl-CoA Delta(11) desaturase [Orchesella cincta]